MTQSMFNITAENRDKANKATEIAPINIPITFFIIGIAHSVSIVVIKTMQSSAYQVNVIQLFTCRSRCNMTHSPNSSGRFVYF